MGLCCFVFDLVTYSVLSLRQLSLFSRAGSGPAPRGWAEQGGNTAAWHFVYILYTLDVFGYLDILKFVFVDVWYMFLCMCGILLVYLFNTLGYICGVCLVFCLLLFGLCLSRRQLSMYFV